MAPNIYTLCACHLWGPRAGAPALPTCSAASPTGPNWLPLQRGIRALHRWAARKIAGHLSLTPSQALGRVEMFRDQTRLLKRRAEVVQQCTPIMTVVEDANLAPAQHADEDRVPTGRLPAHDERTGLEQLHQAFLLLRRQLRGRPLTVPVDQAGQAVQQKGLLPGIETRRAEAPALAQHRHRHLLY